MSNSYGTKYCPHCGERIRKEAVICPHCGCEAESAGRDGVFINNTNVNNQVYAGHSCKDKWVAFLLCIFLGFFGNKFYERKYLLGVVYIFTIGLCGIGIVVDAIALFFKPNPYWV